MGRQEPKHLWRVLPGCDGGGGVGQGGGICLVRGGVPSCLPSPSTLSRVDRGTDSKHNYLSYIVLGLKKCLKLSEQKSQKWLFKKCINQLPSALFSSNCCFWNSFVKCCTRSERSCKNTNDFQYFNIIPFYSNLPCKEWIFFQN